MRPFLYLCVVVHGAVDVDNKNEGMISYNIFIERGLIVMDKFFKNYDAFYNMVLSTTIMSNAQTEEYKNDATKIIQFIGEAYHLDKDFVVDCIDVILNELSRLGVTVDQRAIYGSRKLNTPFSNIDALFDIKGDVLNTLHAIGSPSAQHDRRPTSGQTVETLYINPNWFDYSHYKSYQADVRFAKLALVSATGNLIATRQIGILQMLGIGCEKDVNEAIHRFTQCVIWGDIASMHYLAHAYQIAGNEAKARQTYELATLSKKYLNAGYTVLPKGIEKGFGEEARNLFIYIATIQQDVVIAYNRVAIDFSFVEAILDDSLEFDERMFYINNYEHKGWKDVTHPSRLPNAKLGFI